MAWRRFRSRFDFSRLGAFLVVLAGLFASGWASSPALARADGLWASTVRRAPMAALTTECAVTPQQTQGVVASGAPAGVPGETVVVTSTTVTDRDVYQDILTRPDGSTYFAAYLELEVDPHAQLVNWSAPMLTIDGNSVELVAGTQPADGRWVFENSSNDAAHPSYRVWFPADATAMLAQPTPRTPVLAYPVDGSVRFVLAASAVIPSTAIAGQVLAASLCRSGISDGSANYATDTSTGSVLVIEPQLQLDKQSSPAAVVFPDSEIVYSVVVAVPARTSNGAPVGAAYEVQIVDTLPPGVTVSNDGGGRWDATARTLTFRYPVIQPGSSTTITYKVKIDSGTTGTLTNRAVGSMRSLPASSPGKNYPNVVEDSTTLNISDAGPTISKSVDHPFVLVGESANFAVDVTLPASTTLFNVLVTDRVPTGMTANQQAMSVSCVSGCPAGWVDSALIGLAPTSRASGTTFGFYGRTITTGNEPMVIRMSYPARIDDATPFGTVMTNTARVGANSQDVLGEAVPTTGYFPPNFSFDAQSQATVTAGNVILSIKKTADKQTYAPQRNGSIDYKIVVTNTGNMAAEDVRFWDSLQASGGVASMVLVGDSANDPNVGFRLEDGYGTIRRVPAGGSVTVSLRLTYQPKTPSRWQNFTDYQTVNVAGISSYLAAGVSREATGSSSVTTTHLPGALSLTKSSPDAVLLNGELATGRTKTLRYVLTVTNTGLAPLYDIELTDSMPAGWSLASTAPVTATDPHAGGVPVPLSSSAVAQAGDLLTIKVDSDTTGIWLEPGQSTDVAFTAVTASTPTSVVVNTAKATAIDGLGINTYLNPNNTWRTIGDQDSLRIRMLPVELRLFKLPAADNPGSIEVGKAGSYFLRLTNSSSVSAQSFTIDEPLPAHLALDTSRAPGSLPIVTSLSGQANAPSFTVVTNDPATVNTGQHLRWNVSRLEPGAVLTLEIPVVHDGSVVGSDPELENTASVSYEGGYKQATGVLRLIGQTTPPTVTKVADPKTVTPDDVVTFTATVTLDGSNTLPQYSIAAIDWLPRGMSFVDYVGSPTCLSGPCPTGSTTLTPYVDAVKGQTSIGWHFGNWTTAGVDAVMEMTYTAKVDRTYGGTETTLIPKPGTQVRTGELGGDPLNNRIRMYYQSVAPLASTPTAVPANPAGIWSRFGYNFVLPLPVETPAVSVEKQAVPVQTNPDGTLTYTVTLRNTGLATAFGVRAVDDLGFATDPNLGLRDVVVNSITSSDADATAANVVTTLSANSLSISIGDSVGGLPAGVTVTVQYSAKAPLSAALKPFYNTMNASASAVNNTITLDRYNARPDGAGLDYPGMARTSEVPVFTPVPQTGLGGCPWFFYPGQQTELSFPIANAVSSANPSTGTSVKPGPVSVPGVASGLDTVFVVNLPPGLTWQGGASVSGLSGVPDGQILPVVTGDGVSGQTLTFHLGTTTADSSGSLRLLVGGSRPGQYSGTTRLSMTDTTGATVRGDASGFAYEYAATGGFGCIRPPAISKSVSANTTYAGHSLTWSMSYTASQAGETTPIVWTDDLPAGVTYTAGTATFNNGLALVANGGTISETVSVVAAPSGAHQRIVWSNFPAMTGGSTQLATLPTTTNADVALNTTLTNVISVATPATSGSSGCAVNGAVCASASVLAVSNQVPTITKQVDHTDGELGETFKYRISLRIPAGVETPGTLNVWDEGRNTMVGVPTGSGTLGWEPGPVSISCSGCRGGNTGDTPAWASTQPGTSSVTGPSGMHWWATLNTAAYDRTFLFDFSWRLNFQGEPALSSNGQLEFRQEDYATASATTYQPPSGWAWSVKSNKINVAQRAATLTLDKVCDESKVHVAEQGTANLHCTITLTNTSTDRNAYAPTISDVPGHTLAYSGGVVNWKVIGYGDPLIYPQPTVRWDNARPSEAQSIVWSDANVIIPPGGAIKYKVDLAADLWTNTPSNYWNERAANTAKLDSYFADEGLSKNISSQLTSTHYIDVSRPSVYVTKGSDLLRTTTRDAPGFEGFYPDTFAPRNATPGSTMRWYVLLDIAGAADLGSVTVDDVLPVGFRYVEKSATIAPWSQPVDGEPFVAELVDAVVLPATTSACDPTARFNWREQSSPNAGGTGLRWNFDRRAETVGERMPWEYPNRPAVLGTRLLISFDTIVGAELQDCAANGVPLTPQFSLYGDLPAVGSSKGTTAWFTNSVTVEADDLTRAEPLTNTSTSVTYVVDPLKVTKSPDGTTVTPGSTTVFDIEVSWADFSRPTVTATDIFDLPAGFEIGEITASDAAGSAVPLTSALTNINGTVATVTASWTQPSARGETLCAAGLSLGWSECPTFGEGLSTADIVHGLTDSKVILHIPVTAPTDAIDGTTISNSVSVTSSAITEQNPAPEDGNMVRYRTLPDNNGISAYMSDIPVLTRTEVGDFTVRNPSPPPALTKSGPDTAAPGQTFTYDIAVPLGADKVWTWLVAVDTLPVGLEFVSYGAPTCDGVGCPTASTYAPEIQADGTTKLGWWFGRVTGSSTDRVVHLPVTVRVPASAVAGQTVTNVVSASSKDVAVPEVQPSSIPDPWEVFPPERAQKTTTIIEPRVMISKKSNWDGQSPLAVGDVVQYSVVVANVGNAPAYEFVVRDDLPPFVTDVHSDGSLPSNAQLVKGWTVPEPWMQWRIGTLASGQSVTFTYSVTVKDGFLAAGVSKLTNTATVGLYQGLDPDVAVGKSYRGPSASVDIPLAGPFVSIEKFISAANDCDVTNNAVQVDRAATWCVIVRSSGTVAATNVVVSDLLPSRWSFVADSFEASGIVANDPSLGGTGGGTLPTMSALNLAPTTDPSSGNEMFDWTIGDMAPGTMVVVRYKAAAGAGSAPLTSNRAWVNADLGNGQPAPAVAPGYRDVALTFSRLASAALDITKTPSSQTLPLELDGTTPVSWKIRVTNVGSTDQTAVVIDDTLPPGITADPAQPPVYSTVGSASLPAAQADTVGPNGEQVLHWTVALLPVGTAVEITIQTVLDNDVADTGAIDGLGRFVNDVQTVSQQVRSATVWQAVVDVFATASVGDLIWLDANGDGLQNPGETGLAGATVTLTDLNGAAVVDAFGQPVGAVVTDETGRYSFVGLRPGAYQVHVVGPSGVASSPSLVGTDPAIDSNPTTTAVSLTAGQSNDTIDVGFVVLGSIGDLVWNDADGDGIQDPGESGVPGVTVTLGLPDGTTQVTTTDAQGAYQFINLQPGTYSVTFSGYPAALVPSPVKAAGSNSENDSNGVTSSVTLAAGGVDRSIDFGLKPAPSSIGDRVWHDLNGNGIQDPAEPGIANVVVTLVNANGDTVGSTTTDAGGNYLFSGLVPGSYVVKFSLPTGYEPSTSNVGTDRATDSNGLTATVTTVAGEVNTTIDLGLFQRATIGDYAWLDTNSNGVQDAGEKPAAGVTVQLIQGTQTIATVVTDANGHYLFANLIPGTYTVRFVLPDGLIASPTGAGTVATDSNGMSSTVTVKSGEVNTTIDFGCYPQEGNGGTTPPTTAPGVVTPTTTVAPSGAPTVAPGGKIPATGTNIATTLSVACGMIALGLVALRIRRRRPI